MSKRISPLPTEKSLTIKPPSQPDFKYDLIQSGVANCAALQSKLLCSFLSNWAGGPFITFIFKLIAPFYEMLAEFITELKTLYVCYSFCRARVWYGRCGFNTSPRGPFPIQHILDESNQLWWNTQKKGQISFLGER